MYDFSKVKRKGKSQKDESNSHKGQEVKRKKLEKPKKKERNAPH